MMRTPEFKIGDTISFNRNRTKGFVIFGECYGPEGLESVYYYDIFSPRKPIASINYSNIEPEVFLSRMVLVEKSIKWPVRKSSIREKNWNDNNYTL